MLKLGLDSVKNSPDEWEKAGIIVPRYDIAAAAERAVSEPVWIHFGAGNIFRAFIAAAQQELLNAGAADRGIIVADSFDYDIIDRIYRPHDNLSVKVTLDPDGTTSGEIIGSVAQSLKADAASPDFSRLKEIFRSSSLQLVSFTITEKGYSIYRPDGSFMPAVEQDIESGPDSPSHAAGIIAAMLLERYMAGGFPLAAVSMDNCSHNGEKLRTAVLKIACEWFKRGFVNAGYISYISNEDAVSFPWTMIDKITPRPDKTVERSLAGAGIEGMEPTVTSKNTFIAPFVNAERPQYLVIEDKFPNGRPEFERAGIYMTDRETVNKTERMKVTTCLNPLHTAMSVYGCMLGYTLICDEMRDEDIVRLIKRLGYVEGLPVVVDPGIIKPKAFIDEVVEQRLPNPFMPDAPQRIATDTSQKVGVRFGETVKSYVAENRDLSGLVALPLAIAGWMRYLLAVDDNGDGFEVSSDPMKEELQSALKTVCFGKPESYNGQLKPILANASVFGSDLTKTCLAEKIEEMFVFMLSGRGAVRACLKKYLQ